MAILRHDARNSSIEVTEARLGADDGEILTVIQSARMSGVDVPMGWPRPFTGFVLGHTAGTAQPPASTHADWRRSMAMRRTDQVVREQLGLTPLSVSTERIAYPALRWAAIEAHLRRAGLRVPRDGSGRVCEVYPAAALRSWGLPHRGYKKPSATAQREKLADQMTALFPRLSWNGFREECVNHDDVLDAVIAALVANEAIHGGTLLPPAEDRELALSEGWIHLPLTV